MRAVLFFRLEASFHAYKTARPEIDALREQVGDPLDAAALAAVSLAVDLEALIRDLALRVEKGQIPTFSWKRKFDEAPRFEDRVAFSDTAQRLSLTRPMTLAYLESIRTLDHEMRRFLSASLSG